MTTLVAPIDHGEPRANARELTRFINDAKTELSRCGGKTSTKLNVKAKPTTTKKRTELPHAVISELTTDDVVCVIGEDGYFFFNGVARNGDVKVYGGANGSRAYRAFKSERILKAPITASELKAQLRAKREKAAK